MLVVANGRVFGGGFQIAPGADLGDGRLDAARSATCGSRGRLGMLVRLLRGTHGGAPAVEQLHRRAASGCASTRRPRTRPTASGTRPRAPSCEIETLPGALRVLVPARTA